MKTFIKKHLAKIVVLGIIGTVVLIYIGSIFKYVVGALALMSFTFIAFKTAQRAIRKRKAA